MSELIRRLRYMRFNGKLCYAGIYGHNGRELAASIALLTVPAAPGTLLYKESTFGICRKHLDEWLDFADDNETLEPTKIRWL